MQRRIVDILIERKDIDRREKRSKRETAAVHNRFDPIADLTFINPIKRPECQQSTFEN